MTSRSEQIDEAVNEVREKHAHWLSRAIVEQLDKIAGWRAMSPKGQIDIAEYVATMWAHGYSRGLQRGREKK